MSPVDATSARPEPGYSPLVVGLGGTHRAGSSTELALSYCLAAVRSSGYRTKLLGAEDLDLPTYRADREGPFAEAAGLLTTLRSADGMIIASPGYHGGISGLLKNALDHLEELRNDDPPYLHGRPVGCITCASGPQATTSTLMALRSIVHALRGWPTPLGVALNSAERIWDPNGVPIDQAVSKQLEIVADQVVWFIRQSAPGRQRNSILAQGGGKS